MEQKTAKLKHRKYDANFKKEVLAMVESGRNVPDISQSLGIGANLIYTWVKRSKGASAHSPSVAAVLALDGEKLTLNKRIKELEMERDILKKALGIFSRLM